MALFNSGDDGDEDESLVCQLSNFAIPCDYLLESKISNFIDVDTFSVLHINTRSFNANFSAMVLLVNGLVNKPSIIAVTETWLTKDTDNWFQMPGYTFVSCPRPVKTGGGVGIFIAQSLTFKLCTGIDVIGSDCIESIFIEVSMKSSSNIIIGCIYRPPSCDISNFNNDFAEMLDKIETLAKTKKVILAGDYNVNLLLSDTVNSTCTFLNALRAHSFTPAISLPTRITSTSSTLIDNFFVNFLPIKLSSAIIYSDISDHLPIIIKTPLKCLKPEAKNRDTKMRQINVINTSKFTETLQNQNWDEVHQALADPVTASSGYTCFASRFASLFDSAFPYRNLKSRPRSAPRKEWMTKGLVKCCKKKSVLYKNSIASPSIASKNKYLNYKNKLKSVLKRAEKEYYSEKFKSFHGCQKQTWKLINELINKNKGDCKAAIELTVNGLTVSEPKDVADKFNIFFSSIGSELASKIPSSAVPFENYLSGSFPDTIVLLPTSRTEIINITALLSNKTSYGIDEVPLTLLKKIIDPIAQVLSNLINSSFEIGHFPQELKRAKVCPIFKSGLVSQVSNYRPISILNSISKIYEKAMFHRLTNYLDKYNILIKNQYGFRSSHSSYMALLDLYNKLSLAADEKLVTVGVFIDLQKAFDSLDHTILLSKLKHYGIRGRAYDWLTSYLYKRDQYVCLNGVSSTMRPITCGVPQGSIIGPLLFIIYINDIINCAPSLHFLLFADDTNLLMSGRSCDDVMARINPELSNLSMWFCANKLSLNVTKTNYILFGSKRSFIPNNNFRIIINNSDIVRVHEVKFLGVLIDEELSWKSHTASVAAKLSRNVGVLYKLKSVIDKNTLLTLYYALIQPHLMYCVIVWGGSSQTALDKLTKLQKRAVRIVSGSSYLSHTNPLFRQLNLLNLSDLYKKEIITFMYRCKNNLLPPCCHNLIKPAKPPLYGLRSHNDFEHLYCRTAMRQASIAVQGPILWNVIPASMKLAATLSIFKQQLSIYLLQNSC
jgi:exonuclease III